MTARARFLHILSIALALALSGTASASERTTNLMQINADDYFASLGWNFTTGSWAAGTPSPAYLGGGATVAVFDGLANQLHVDLPYVPGGNPYTQSVVLTLSGGTYTVYDHHGTHVSGIVGARLNGSGTAGVAPEARLLNFAVFDDNGWIGANQTALVATAISYGASAVNMSYGPTTPGDLALSSTLVALNSYRANVVGVISAGNDGRVIRDETFTTTAATPLTNLIVVGSVGQNNQIAFYSNTPGESCIVVNGACSIKVKDIFMVAPGGDPYGIVAPGAYSSTSYVSMMGTSMAAPHVAGAVALLHSVWPWLKTDPLATRNILFDTAQDLGAPGTDGVYGQGLLDVMAAMSPVGTPVFSTGGGSETTTTTTATKKKKKKGKKNKKRKKKKKKKKKRAHSTTYVVADSQFVGTRAFAGLSESDVVVSMFDDYGRDFPIALAGLTTSSDVSYSGRLSEMFFDGTPIASPTPVQPSFAARAHQLTDLGLVPRGEVHADIISQWQVSDRAVMFAGQGDPAPLFLTPSTGALFDDFTDAELSGVNPVLGLAVGDFFTGAALTGEGPWRLALGMTQNRTEPADIVGIGFEHDARALVATVPYAADETFDAQLSFTRLNEDRSILGAGGAGALAFGSDNVTHAVTGGWNWRVASGLDVSASYTMAVTKAGGQAGLLTLDDDVRSTAFYLGLARSHNFAEDDRIALSVSQPLRVADGAALWTADAGFDADGVMQTQATAIGLTPSGRELDLQLAYTLPLHGGGEVSLFAFNAFDAGHREGATESGVGARYGLRFKKRFLVGRQWLAVGTAAGGDIGEPSVFDAGFHVCRIEFEGTVDVAPGAVVIAGFAQRHAAQHQRIHIGRVAPQRPVEIVDHRRPLAAHALGEGAADVKVGIAGVELNGGAEHGLGLVGPGGEEPGGARLMQDLGALAGTADIGVEGELFEAQGRFFLLTERQQRKGDTMSGRRAATTVAPGHGGIDARHRIGLDGRNAFAIRGHGESRRGKRHARRHDGNPIDPSTHVAPSASRPHHPANAVRRQGLGRAAAVHLRDRLYRVRGRGRGARRGVSGDRHHAVWRGH